MTDRAWPIAKGFPHRGVSLDIDGTLYSLGWFKFQLAIRRGLDLREWITMEQVRKRIRRERPQDPDMHGRIVRAMAQELKTDPDTLAVKVTRMIDEDWPMLLGHVGVYRGVMDMLGAFRAAGIPVVLNSDYPGRIKAAALGLADYPFIDIIDATAVGALKPRPEPFIAAAEALGLPPKDVLHVGDSPELDILGAHSAGLATARVGTSKKVPPGVVCPDPMWSFASVPAFCAHVVATLGGDASSA